jgi:hypothetical protein
MNELAGQVAPADFDRCVACTREFSRRAMIYRGSAAVIALLVSFVLDGRRTNAADVIELDAVITSGFLDGGVHFPHHMNYFVGYSIPSAPIERRNYFVFNLADLEGPILSAKLKLWLPGGETMVSGYLSSDPHEEYRISGSPFPVTGFMDAFFGEPHITPAMVEMMYDSLGAMPPYGMTLIGPDHSGTDIVIELTTEGIMALNGALGSLIVLGGRLTDLHIDDPDDDLPSELVFAYTEVGDSVPMPRLELVVVPEPSTTWLFGVGLLVLAVVLGRKCRR